MKYIWKNIVDLIKSGHYQESKFIQTREMLQKPLFRTKVILKYDLKKDKLNKQAAQKNA